MKVCATHGCPEFAMKGGVRCGEHTVVKPSTWDTSTRRKPKGWGRTRQRVMRRDANLCRLCGKVAFVVDHLLPQAWGGGEQDVNLRALCEPCHKKKTSNEAALGRTLSGMGPKERSRAISDFIIRWGR